MKASFNRRIFQDSGPEKLDRVLKEIRFLREEVRTLQARLGESDDRAEQILQEIQEIWKGDPEAQRCADN